MNKLGNVFQAAYLGFAVLFLYQAIINWGIPGGRSYLYLAVVAVALFKFFFNRKYRKRFETHYKKREEEQQKKK
jgi:hypothetical protein